MRLLFFLLHLLSHQLAKPSWSLPRRQDFLKEASEFSCFNQSLPNITIYATGGTIAGSAGSTTQTTGYKAGVLGIQALVDAVPQLCEVANVRGVQAANVDSVNVNSAMLLELSHQIHDDLDSGHTQGAVITHGTDTLEESAFFLDLTIDSELPVVVTGSMRPATAISADGPMNLLSSVKLASSESARGRGVMIVLNDRIGSARFMSKSDANQLDAFQSTDGGLLGSFVNIQPVFFYPPARPLGHHHFDVREIPRWHRGEDGKLPQVDVLYAHQELNVGLFQAAIDLGAKGIVLAGLGAGYWTDVGSDKISRALQDSDIPVIVSRRPTWGCASSNGLEGIGAGYLNPQRARIQLQLALETGLETESIRAIFEHHGVH
ncbi:Asparaginase/glutaminase [Thelonectria olida]|uniref:asparaginase n=1 Tax=Thelonectria olida TaxID=1576542 RepID=A0A9P8VXB5_9HYPO|nr:Asparaginase/glutaminase [Thelonectria olida]